MNHCGFMRPFSDNFPLCTCDRASTSTLNSQERTIACSFVNVDFMKPPQVEQIRRAVAFYFPAREGRPLNGRLLEPAIIVSWGGFSITLTCLYAIAASLQWDKSWDYFINLSTSDFPVMTQVREEKRSFDFTLDFSIYSTGKARSNVALGFFATIFRSTDRIVVSTQLL